MNPNPTPPESEADTRSVSQFSSVSKYLEFDVEPESEDDSDDEMEPKLKYERLSSDLKKILEKDAASGIAVHTKFIVLGSHWGMIHVLDANGNSLPSHKTQAHALSVNQLSVDHAGEYIASCSHDGKIIISGLLSNEHGYNCILDRPIRSISIDPLYTNPSFGRRFMTGDDRVVLHEKTFFNRYKQIVLGEGEGPITLIKWRGQFTAWSCNKGVRVYDVTTYQRISLVKHQCPIMDAVPCRIAWNGQFKLLVAQGDYVNICTIKRRPDGGQIAKDLPIHMVEITTSFRLTDQWICGIAPLDDMVVLLTVPKAKSPEGKSERPQLMVVDPFTKTDENTNYTIISTDLLTIRGYEEYKPKDYHLECLIEDKHFFIVSPKDVVLGKPRDLDDHLGWLINHELYSDALDEAEKDVKNLKRYTLLEIGRLFINHLLDEARFEEAGKLCVRIFGKDKKLWQDEVFRFARLEQLRAIAPYLPTARSHRLDKAVYEMVLFEFLKTDEERFLEFIRLWDCEMYNIEAIVRAVVEQLLLSADNVTLLRALASLYTHQRKFDKAMAMYLKLGHPDVFHLIRQHDLYSSCHDKIEYLMELDSDEALALFLQNIDKLPPKLIVTQMREKSKYLFKYLDALARRDWEESKPYHGMLVELFADYAPERLLHFLKSSDNYPIQEALNTCEIRGLTPERIYVLARMGNTRQALQLITRELADIHQAVEFCKEYNDDELWNDLIDYSIDKPYFIKVLLDNVGTHIDPIILIRKIEHGQEIPKLRDSLVNIMQDYNLQISLQEGCKRILVTDCFSLLQKQFKFQTRGIGSMDDLACSVCNYKIVQANGIQDTTAKDIVMFICRHAFHVDCLPESNQCTICHKSS